MHIREQFTFRLTFLIVVFVLGNIAGFSYHLTKDEKKKPKKKIDIEYAKKALDGSSFEGFEFLEYEGNHLVQIIRAKKAYWESGSEKIKLEFPEIIDMENGKIVGRSTGDFATIKIKKSNQIGDIHLEGNIRFTRFLSPKEGQ